jgi:formylglycine-generating enzyme required for sulfatase activity
MSWPLPQDYNEAIQSPAARLADEELRRGQPVLNRLGLPLPRSGNFADVYEFAGPSGKWALKCFTREVPRLRERYAAISDHLRRVNLSFMVDFDYLDRGIRIHDRWYPVVKMRWVEGLTLNEFARTCADKPQTLELLAGLWVRLARRLRDANVAHGDLQHGNVLLVAGGDRSSLDLKLVDYDGMWVPALARWPSGEAGHPNFQHPQRLREGTYSQDVDKFSHLVIYTALRCLAAGGRSLWERYDNGDNLLFRQRDFEDPDRSALFQELLGLPDPAVRGLVGRLVQAAKSPLEQTPTLDDVVSTGPPASAASTKAKEAAPPWVEEVFASATRETSRAKESPQAKKSPPRKSRPLAAALAAGFFAGVVLTAVATLFLQGGRNRSEHGGASGQEGPIAEEPEKFIINSIGMKFAWLPPGSFQMGSPLTEEKRDINEFQHKVTLSKGFYMGVYPVTQEQWGAVMGDNPSRFKDEESLPVDSVSWHDCQEFIKKLREKDKKPYRLPTEAEWEYACRAGTTTPFYCGETISTDQANYNGSHSVYGGTYAYGDGKKGVYRGKTTPVGSFPPNAWGLYDMHGNVWQWCQDWRGYYPVSDVIDPQGPHAGADRVLRGGAWNHNPDRCRSALRGGHPPDSRHADWGFRLCFSETKKYMVDTSGQKPP